MSLHWIDSHCHLEMTKEIIPDLFSKDLENQLDYCITIGTDQTSNLQVVEICRQHDQLFGTLGVHPHEASKITQEQLNFIESESTRNSKIVAIGECGFDLYYGLSDKKSQREAFEKQLDIACRTNLPVVIHTRKAESDTIEILSNFKNQNLKGVFHCFTSSIDLAHFALDMGFHISFNGIVTFPKSKEVKQVLSMTPLERILLETDSPYLAPVPHRGKTNSPKYVSVVGHFISEFLNISVQELSDITTQNTKRLFSRISDGS